MLWVALAGLLLGFASSFPVAGPVAILVVTRSLQGHARSGILIGVGSALSEASYALLAYLGFSVFLADLPLVVPISRAVATVILVVLGILLLRYHPPERFEAPRTRSAGHLMLGFTISALNPTLIVTWTAALGVIASTGLVEFDRTAAPAFAIGVAVGIAGWYTVEGLLVGHYRERFRPATIRRLHRIMGLFVLGLSLFFAVALIRG
jgi:threonine/homoserine/homoserine lactone efflux protein